MQGYYEKIGNFNLNIYQLSCNSKNDIRSQSSKCWIFSETEIDKFWTANSREKDGLITSFISETTSCCLSRGTGTCLCSGRPISEASTAPSASFIWDMAYPVKVSVHCDVRWKKLYRLSFQILNKVDNDSLSSYSLITE